MSSERTNVRCLHALGAALSIEFNLLRLAQLLESVASDRAEVREQVGRAVIGSDEAVAFFGVEPFHGASGHRVFPSLLIGPAEPPGMPRRLKTRGRYMTTVH